MMEELYHENNKYILFGASKLGLKLKKLLPKKDVICFCDNNRQVCELDGIKVIRPKDIDRYYNDNVIIVVCAKKSRSIAEISGWIESNGYKYSFYDEVCDRILKQEGRYYNTLNKRGAFAYTEELSWFCPFDRTENAANIDSYFYQDLWAAERILESGVKLHWDIGSRVDGLISHLLSSGLKINLVDLRPLPLRVENLDIIIGDAVECNFVENDSIESLSAICSIEHFGLGRYGDQIDPEACFKFINRIQKKMAKEGKIYISVPIGKDRLQFNAHRIFSPSTIINLFNCMKLLEFSVVENGIIQNANYCDYDNINKYGPIGLFIFEKI